MAVLRQIRGFKAWRQHLKARRLGSTEGCSYVLDFDFKPCCDAHDLAYKTHQDPTTKEEITREQADDAMYACIVSTEPPSFWRNMVAWVYWAFLRWSSLAQETWDRRGEL